MKKIILCVFVLVCLVASLRQNPSFPITQQLKDDVEGQGLILEMVISAYRHPGTKRISRNPDTYQGSYTHGGQEFFFRVTRFRNETVIERIN